MGGTASVPVVVQDALKSLSQADQQQLQSRFAKATGSNDASSRVPTSTIQGWLSLMPSAVPCVLESWRAHLGLESQSSSPEHAAMMERDLFTVVTATVSSGSSLARAQLFAFVFWAFGRKTVEALAKQPCLPPLTLFEDVSFDHVHAAARQLVHTCLSSSEGDKKARQDGGSTLVGLLVQTLLDINDDDADTTAAAEKETVTATLNDIARRCVRDPVCIRLCEHVLSNFALPASKIARRQPLISPTFAASTLLSPPECMAINEHLPSRVRNQWSLAFSNANDGSSFAKFRGCIEDSGSTLLIVRDRGGHVFGGFAAQPWCLQADFYGNEETFLFSVRPNLRFYQSDGHNRNFQYFNLNSHSRPNGIAFGGQFEYFGLFIAADMMRGHCKGNPCSTFLNPPLSSTEEFEIDAVEAWRVGPLVDGAGVSGGGKSVLDGHKEDKMLLELHGKKMHSAGLREPHPEDDEDDDDDGGKET